MATKQAIGLMLAYLHELFPSRPPITEATLEAWMVTFEDVTDDYAMMNAAKQCGAEPERRFFPAPGEIRVYLPQPSAEPAAETLKKIEAIGGFNWQMRWCLPTVEAVRAHFGETVAQAYGHVGPHRLGSDTEMTREIAERDFAVALEQQRARSRASEPDTRAIAARSCTPALPASNSAPRDDGEPLSAIERWYAERDGVSKRLQPPSS